MAKIFSKINVAIMSALLIFFAGTLFGNGAEKYLAPQQDESEEILIFKDGKWQVWDSSYIAVAQEGWRDLNIPVRLDANTECKIGISEMRECEIEIFQEMEIWNAARETTAVLSAKMELPPNANIKDIAEYIYFPYVVDTVNWGML